MKPAAPVTPYRTAGTLAVHSAAVASGGSAPPHGLPAAVGGPGVTLPATHARTRLRDRAAVTAVPAALLGLSAAPVLATNGDYYPTSWGWAAVALGWAAAVAAVFRERSAPTVYELVFAGGLAAFAAWLVVSMAWTEAPTGTPLEIERTLVYVGAAAALLAVARRDQTRLLLGGVCEGTTLVCAYRLATRLLPDHFAAASSFGGQRLASPVGYWNGLGASACSFARKSCCTHTPLALLRRL